MHIVANARAHHHVVSFAGEQIHQLGNALIGIRAIGVGDADDVVLGVADAGFEGRAVTFVDPVAQESDGVLGGDNGRVIRRPIIHHNHLKRPARLGHIGQQRFQHRPQTVFFVVRGNDN